MASLHWETSAIVLDSLDHGESDKILTFYSLDYGRFCGIAKGANRSKKRFQNKLELFSHIHIDCSEKPSSTLVFIADAELISGFLSLRCQLERYVIATFIREIVLTATRERQKDNELFELLLWSLETLEAGGPPLDIAAMFLLRLFTCLGYQPSLAESCQCGAIVDNSTIFSFHHQHGQLFCPECLAAEGGTSTEISMGTIRLLISAQREDLDRLHRLHFSRKARQQALTMLHRYARNLFQREIQSWKAVRNLL